MYCRQQKNNLAVNLSVGVITFNYSDKYLSLDRC
jgi:hypothetical protein